MSRQTRQRKDRNRQQRRNVQRGPDLNRPAHPQWLAAADRSILEMRRDGRLDPDQAHALAVASTQPGATYQQAGNTILAGLLHGLSNVGAAQEPFHVLIRSLLDALRAADATLAVQIAQSLSDPAPIYSEIDDTPYGGCDLLNFELTQAFERLWPEGTTFTTESLNRIAVDCETAGRFGRAVFAYVAGYSAEVSGWGFDADILDEWVATQTDLTVPENETGDAEGHFGLANIALQAGAPVSEVALAAGQVLLVFAQ